MCDEEGKCLLRRRRGMVFSGGLRDEEVAVFADAPNSHYHIGGQG